MYYLLSILAILGSLTSPIDAAETKCACDPAKSWNDIFMLFDGSENLKLEKFNEMLNYFFSTAGMLTIGQAQRFQTRVGIITYGNKATVIAGLDKYSTISDLFNDIGNVVRTNTEGTNITGAIHLARDAFQGPTHRSSSRKVIMIGASTYRNGSYALPTTEANTFKDNGGVIIVVAYGDLNGDLSAELQQIASPGYYIDAKDSIPTVVTMTRLLCSANCFCPSTYGSPSRTSSNEAPTEGCFQTSNQRTDEFAAKDNCALQNNGLLAAVPNSTQQLLITKDYINTPIYVGLERSPNGQWTWFDGTPFTGSINDNGGDCATLTRVSGGFKTRFDSVQCSSPELYACQASPCSTDVFCGV